MDLNGNAFRSSLPVATWGSCHWLCVNVESTITCTMEISSLLLILLIIVLKSSTLGVAVLYLLDVMTVHLWFSVTFYWICDNLFIYLLCGSTWNQDLYHHWCVFIVYLLYQNVPSCLLSLSFCRGTKSSPSSKWKLSGRPGSRWMCKYHLLLFGYVWVRVYQECFASRPQKTFYAVDIWMFFNKFYYFKIAPY